MDYNNNEEAEELEDNFGLQVTNAQLSDEIYNLQQKTCYNYRISSVRMRAFY